MRCNHRSPVRRLRKLAALVPALAALPALTGCWPLAPIAAVAAAIGGDDDDDDKVVGVALSGTIVTDGTVFDTSLDREPNDSLGFAPPVGPIGGASARPRRLGGSTELRSTLHLLLDGSVGPAVARQELLVDEAQRFAAGAPGVRQIARRGNELFLIESDGGRTTVRVTPLVSPFVKRRVELGLDVEPAGAAACLDALIVLDSGATGARLVAFDADDGRPLVITDLGRGGLAQLAGAEELSTGRTRLFTADPRRGELFEIAVTAGAGDRRFGGLIARGAPAGVSGGIAALAWDGVLLHVVDGAGALHSFEPDALAPVATRPLLAAGERALALAAHFDLGLDGYHVEVPAGRTLAVEFAATGEREDGRFFLAAIERGSIAQESLETPAPVVRTTSAQDRPRLELAAPGGSPRGFDVVVGTLAGAGRYEIALGGRARAPLAGSPRERGAAAAALSTWIENEVIAQLSSGRLVEIYRDPLLPEFAPGRIVLGRAEKGAALALPEAPKGFSLRRVSRSPSGWDVVALANTAEYSGPAARTLHGEGTRRGARREQARSVLAALDGLAGARGVAWSEPLWIARALAVPNDPGFAANQQPHYDLLNLQPAWDITTGASSTVLAVVDTGVRNDNVDLNANVGPDGYDFVTGSNNGDGDGIDPDPFDPGTFASNSHHGSHVGGTMGARGNNATQGTGICWDAELMPVRALGTDRSGFTTDIADGIHYAAQLNNASGTLPASRAAVINLSLGLSSPSNVIHTALINAVNVGCIVMCAAGNDGNGTAVLYPAAFPEAIAVAAADNNGDVTFYSNSGPEIDITCSGGAASGNSADDIWSTTGVGVGGSLQPLAGTSMACAHASGVAGLMVTAAGPIDQDTARTILTGTAVDIETVGFDNLSGWGLVDAAAAVNGSLPILDLSAAMVDFGNTGTNLVVQARDANPFTDNLIVNPNFVLTPTYTPAGGVPTTAWLSPTLLADGKTIHLRADRGVIGFPGDYEVQVDVTSNGGNDFFLVGLTTGLGGVTDVGPILIDAVTQTGTLVRRTTAVASSGYAWSLTGLGNVPYFLRCGVDVDGDGVIGEAGEPYGAYPSVAGEQLLELDGLSSLQIDLLLE